MKVGVILKIILIRHGQTEWNSLKKYQGHTDIALNDYGRKQASKAANYLLHNENIEAIYCSDLSRTRETAKIIAKKLNMNFVCDLRLREINFGLWEGMTFSEIYKKYPDQYSAWYNNTIDFEIPGGESFRQLSERTKVVLNEIKERHRGTVAVVTHGGVIKAILYHMDRNDSLWETAVEPGSITTLEAMNGVLHPVEIGLRIKGECRLCKAKISN